MMSRAIGQSAVMAAALALMMPLASLPAGAQGELKHSSVRLLDAMQVPEGALTGIEIDLEPGWKTYWRMPGEAGIPPQLAWQASRNLEALEMFWPAPKRFADELGETIGYKDRVVFPLLVRPRDETEPVTLKLTLHYAVCKDICVPAKAELERMLATDGAKPLDRILIDKFRARVPHAASDALEVAEARLSDAGGTPVLSVRLSGEQARADADVFVESGDVGYFRKPRLHEHTPQGVTLHLPVDGLKSLQDLRGQTVTLTVVSGDERLVHETVVD